MHQELETPRMSKVWRDSLVSVKISVYDSTVRKRLGLWFPCPEEYRYAAGSKLKLLHFDWKTCSSLIEPQLIRRKQENSFTFAKQ